MTKYEPLFAKYYDYIVHDRREALAVDEDVAFLKEVFASNLTEDVREILDVGCGTGRYLVPLVETGFNVTGIDNSPDMLAQCEARLNDRGLSAKLVELDLMQLSETEKYDAVICMNSVISYFLDTEDILKALSLFYAALRPGGLLVLEIWNALANASLFGTTSVYKVRDGNVRVVNRQKHDYDPFRSIYRGKLDVTVVDSGKRHSFSREEVIRVMTVGEIIAYLKAAGFANISVNQRKDTLDDSGDEELVFLASHLETD